MSSGRAPSPHVEKPGPVAQNAARFVQYPSHLGTLSPKKRHPDKQRVGVHAPVRISQIRIRYLVVFASHIDGCTAVRCEQLNTTAILSSEVELRRLKHRMIEVDETATGCKKWFHIAIVN